MGSFPRPFRAELAAKYLATKYGFSVNSSFTAYGDLYDALRRGDISFALVDSSLVHEHLNKTVFALVVFRTAGEE